MDNSREIFGWKMYDWANSTFSTVVVTALLGPYLLTLSEGQNPINLFGTDIQPAAIFPTAASLSVFLQVFFLPLLGTVADYTNLKKRMMMTFAYVGATFAIMLFFIQPDMPVIGTNGAILLGSLFFIIANFCFGAAIVFYNAYLPDIAPPALRDKISSEGWGLGYLGGGLLLLVNLGMLTLMEDTGLAVRLSLASAGVWWLVFTYLFPQQRLQVRAAARSLPAGTTLIQHGFRQIRTTLSEMRDKYPMTLRYLLAYLVYNDGIQTVIVVSTAFAAQELGVEATTLLLLVLMIQFVAFFGAIGFGKLAGRIGAKRSIMITLVIWSILVIYAYGFLVNVTQLFVMGFFLALVLGGSQALSRSLFSQMIPLSQESEYFGFYEISERGTSWIGPLLFAAAVQITGSQRIALVSLIVFFVLGLALFVPVDVRQAMVDAGHDPEGVVL